MITAYLQGGTANLMHQFAAAYAQARRFDTEVLLDISSFDHDPLRRYTLGLFKGINNPLVRYQPPPIISENGLPYDPDLVARVTKNCTMRGYFQNENYYKEYRSDLMKIFEPLSPLSELSQQTLQQILAEGERSVFLTIRRTDYVGNDFHGVLPVSYYEEAAKIIAAKIDNPCFFVFSDDPDWCKNEFVVRFPYRTVIAGNFDRTTKEHLGREDAELWLMRHCRHACMANSSYSWMGAWMGADVTGGIVICPKQWFGKASKEDSSGICPERWLSVQ